MSAAERARPGRRRARTWRRFVPPVLGGLLVLGVGGGLWWWLGPEEEPTPAQRIGACQRDHGIQRQSLTEAPEQVLRRCAWPAPGDEADGYHEIAVSVTEPQVDGNRVAYTITSPCTQLAYELAGRGRRIRADPGQVVEGATGGPVFLTPELLEVVPELSPGTLVVLTTGGRRLVDVACV